VVEEAILKNKIIKQATDIGLQDKWTSKLVRHAVSEFSKKDLARIIMVITTLIMNLKLLTSLC
jgi:hypothetical protein